MVKPSVDIEGMRELRRALKDIEGGVADLKSTHKAAAEVVEKRALDLVPRRTGSLAGTLRSTGQARTGVVRAGFARVPYAGPIHFGWPRRNISPQPFLYDALDDRRTEVVDVYIDRLQALINKHGL